MPLSLRGSCSPYGMSRVWASYVSKKPELALLSKLGSLCCRVFRVTDRYVEIDNESCMLMLLVDTLCVALI
jgi:hypothetical protein